MNRDPLGEAGGLNLYGLVQNNPVNWVDPLGLAGIAVDVGGGAGSFLTGANNAGSGIYFGAKNWAAEIGAYTNEQKAKMPVGA
jgi:uncharacterized protein RhaS with RHS repeats